MWGSDSLLAGDIHCAYSVRTSELEAATSARSYVGCGGGATGACGGDP